MEEERDGFDVDPLEQADLYQTYGKTEQAINVLQEALESNPRRRELYARLLTLYADADRRNDFLDLAERMRSRFGPNNPDWQEIAAKGQTLFPGNALFVEEKNETAEHPVPAALMPELREPEASLEPSQPADAEIEKLDFDFASWGDQTETQNTEEEPAWTDAHQKMLDEMNEQFRALDETHGCPVALYSDRHSIFTKHHPEDTEPTQFQRATEALGIATIQALSPQAKGRVERLFQTLQDRLVKALRLAGISDQDAANAWLPQYLQQHNAHFAVAACDDEDAHQPYDGSPETLARICAIHHRRTLSKDLVLSFQRQRYIIQTGGAPRYALRGRRVDVVVHADGRIELVTGGEVLLYKVFDSPQEIPHPVDDKSLNARVDAILTSRRWSEKSRPAADHPWRRYPTVDRPGK